MKNLSFLPAFLLLVFTLSSCSRNPVTGKRQFVLMSENQELAMGAQADPEILQIFGLYDDPALQAFITEKGNEMAAISHRPKLKYEFKVVDSPILNAFAVPGGYVYFTRGIMAHFNNEAEFAGVLGHEIGHITARHSVVQQRNQLLSQLGLIAGIIALPELAQFAEPASAGLGLLLLKFGRDAERESDKLGVEYSTKIGYDAKYMGRFFNTLERMQTQSGAQAIPDFLSSHPNPGDRFVTVGKLAEEWQKKMNLQNPLVNRANYLKKIDGLVVGEDPRQGFVENSTFYHPDLKFEFKIPTGWKHQNSPSSFQAAPQDGKAVLQLTLAPTGSLQEVSNAFIQQYKLTVVEQQNTTVNGLSAVRVVADQIAEQSSIRVMVYFIKHGTYNYSLLGAAQTVDFAGVQQSLSQSMQSFRNLTDSDKLNRKPERIKIVNVSSESTLRDLLRQNQMPESRFEELSILNGMQLTDRVPAGDMIKIVR